MCITVKEVKEWLENDDCRRLGLGLAVDGIADCCMASESAVLCDVCERHLQAVVEPTISHLTSSSVSSPATTQASASAFAVESGATIVQSYPEPTTSTSASAVVSRAGDVQSSRDALSLLEMNLERALELLHDCCGICRVFKGMVEEHTLWRCPMLVGRCLRCLKRGHSTHSCIEGYFNVPYSYCHKCQLPTHIGDVFFHHKTNTFGPQCKNLEKGLLSIIALYEIVC